MRLLDGGNVQNGESVELGDDGLLILQTEGLHLEDVTIRANLSALRMNHPHGHTNNVVCVLARNVTLTHVTFILTVPSGARSTAKGVAVLRALAPGLRAHACTVICEGGPCFSVCRDGCDVGVQVAGFEAIGGSSAVLSDCEVFGAYTGYLAWGDGCEMTAKRCRAEGCARGFVSNAKAMLCTEEGCEAHGAVVGFQSATQGRLVASQCRSLDCKGYGFSAVMRGIANIAAGCVVVGTSGPLKDANTKSAGFMAEGSTMAVGPGCVVDGLMSGFRAGKGGVMKLGAGCCASRDGMVAGSGGFVVVSGGRMEMGGFCEARGFAMGIACIGECGESTKVTAGEGCAAHGCCYGFMCEGGGSMRLGARCAALSCSSIGFGSMSGSLVAAGAGCYALGCGVAGFVAAKCGRIEAGPGCWAMTEEKAVATFAACGSGSTILKWVGGGRGGADTPLRERAPGVGGSTSSSKHSGCLQGACGACVRRVRRRPRAGDGQAAQVLRLPEHALLLRRVRREGLAGAQAGVRCDGPGAPEGAGREAAGRGRRRAGARHGGRLKNLGVMVGWGGRLGGPQPTDDGPEQEHGGPPVPVRWCCNLGAVCSGGACLAAAAAFSSIATRLAAAAACSSIASPAPLLPCACSTPADHDT